MRCVRPDAVMERSLSRPILGADGEAHYWERFALNSLICVACLCCSACLIASFSLMLRLLKTPGLDRPAAGLNLCNSLSCDVVFPSYASPSGPLIGALAPVGVRLHCSECHWRPVTEKLCRSVPGAPAILLLAGGCPTTSIPSLEERLDDHQPTRAWEHREDSSREGRQSSDLRAVR